MLYPWFENQNYPTSEKDDNHLDMESDVHEFLQVMVNPCRRPPGVQIVNEILLR